MSEQTLAGKQQICLKSVDELRLRSEGDHEPMRYFIPAYQRGYRWERQQVTQLLDDIREFTKRENPQPDEFYCLQPLVLRLNEDGAFEVVDGQQRLTTLLLILRHFNSRLAARYQQKLYGLDYKTRPDLLEFLDNLSEERAQGNIDFFHLHQAVVTIEDWFESRESEVETIKGALLNQAKVIWFQLATDEAPVNAFTRLNVGKIPLSNDELIRALFLRRPKKNQAGIEPLQLKIAHEWDQIEKTLQDNDFWCFLSNDISLRGSRIGFLFDLIAREGGMAKSNDSYATFYYFSEKLNAKGANTEQEWLSVKRASMQLEEWFKDRQLYHLIGFLIWAGMEVGVLRDLAKDRTKKYFKEALKAAVYERALRAEFDPCADAEERRELIVEKIGSLAYGRNSPQIRALLLLFNLASLLQHQASNMRFQFEGFKKQHWDIEHVCSVADDAPGRPNTQREWLDQCLTYLKAAEEGAALQQEIEQFKLLSAAEVTKLFVPLYDKVRLHFQELDQGEDVDNSMANLVLLDQGTNRSYKNAVFAIKRQRVLALDRAGVFVPLCTRNVFLKCYSPRVDHAMFWTKADREGYQQTLIETLQQFFEGSWLHG